MLVTGNLFFGFWTSSELNPSLDIYTISDSQVLPVTTHHLNTNYNSIREVSFVLNIECLFYSGFQIVESTKLSYKNKGEFKNTTLNLRVTIS